MLPMGRLAHGWRAGSGCGGSLAGRVGPGGERLVCRVGQGGAAGGGGWAGIGRLQKTFIQPERVYVMAEYRTLSNWGIIG